MLGLMDRIQDWVSVDNRDNKYSFVGYRYGFTPGCWIVSKGVASKICKLFNVELPRWGHDRLLDQGHGWKSFITHHGIHYRVTLYVYSHRQLKD